VDRPQAVLSRIKDAAADYPRLLDADGPHIELSGWPIGSNAP